MRYAQIRSLDISNGQGIGVALFVQGCKLRCHGCFNPETWDFNGGKVWTQEVKDKFLKLASKPYITRVSILGGEPLADENLDDVLDLVNRIRLSYPQKSIWKSIWLYTGYTWDSIINYQLIETDDFDYIEESYIDGLYEKRKKIISQCDILVDGRYIESQRNITLPWCGSTNQRVISVQESLKQNRVILYNTQ